MRRLLITCLFLAGVTPVFSQTAATRDAASPNLITLKNELVTLTIDLANGAHAVSCLYAGFNNEEIVRDVKNDNGGLFKDLWTIQGWPGEFDQRRFEAEIVNAGPEEAVVKTWTTSTGKMGSKFVEDLADFRVEKTFSLRAGERVLTVRYAFTNNSVKGKRPAFWSQHAFDFDGKRKNNVYWRPTENGVDWIDDNNRVSANNRWFATGATAGWNGTTNRTLKRGVMFLMDYNDLQQLYDNTGATTTEWMYDDVAVPAGKTWTTTIKLILAEGFGAFAFGSEQLLGAIEPKDTPAGLRIDLTLAAATRPLTKVTVKTRVKGVRAPWSVDAEPFTAETLGLAPLAKTVNATGLGPLPCVVAVTVTGTDGEGRPVTITYEDYYGGSAGRNVDLATLEPIYQFPVPPKQKQYLKPDVIKLQHPKPARILFIRGLWAEYQGIDEAVKGLADVTVVNGWMKKSALGETLGGFPAAYEDLLSYDVIILGNVSGPMLSTVGQEMLADFLKVGGGVLMLSGDRTYGQTTFSNANFADLLPYTSTFGDYGRLMKTSLTLKGGVHHEVTQGVTFGKDDVVLYAHILKPKENAQVPVTLEGGSPALILSGENKPRVAVVTALPFGEASAEKTLYFHRAGWQTLMAHTLGWLLGRR